MAQIGALKFLFFCFFSGAPTENVYQAMHSYGMRLLCEAKKMCPIWAHLKRFI